jgi:predicted site-specific integrase-resolvase
MQDSKNLLDQTEAAKSLGISPKTLQKWRSTGQVSIPFVRIGKCVRYNPADIENFKAANTVGETAA